MEITTENQAGLLIVRLRGRLDSTHCSTVETSLAGFIKAGEHQIRLDMAAVDYISSTGLRVLLGAYKQLKSVKGRFSIAPASPAVVSVLELAGLDLLLAVADAPAAPTASSAASTAASAVTRPDVTGELFALAANASLSVQLVTDPTPRPYANGTFALGVGALGPSLADGTGRHGEFLAAAGCAVYQPTDGASRPDWVVTQGALIPQAGLLDGLSATGHFSHLLRFAPAAGSRSVSLTALAAAALDLAAAPVVGFVAVVETTGLVGATLRRDPATAPADRFAFPQIRDWLSFTGDRAFRDSTALLVGFAARPGSAGSLASQLRPLSGEPNAPLGHVHATVVAYRPLTKGRIDLAPTVAGLFEPPGPQAVLHLLGDPRGHQGAGESTFESGAFWFAPVKL
jgi:anti-anti-sigma factor